MGPKNGDSLHNFRTRQNRYHFVHLDVCLKKNDVVLVKSPADTAGINPLLAAYMKNMKNSRKFMKSLSLVFGFVLSMFKKKSCFRPFPFDS